MKNKIYLTAISAILMLASCSSEDMADIIPEVQTYSPMVQGVIGELRDAKTQVITKSGVIEDNPDYPLGEKFYWHDGDKAKVLFFPNGNLNATPIELIYTATVAGDTKSNTCQFSTTGNIPTGNYSVYALYPADGWSKDATGYKAEFPNVGLDGLILFSEASSAHLKDYMFMKADAGNVTISGASDNAINFNFKHLTSVVRFHITSDYNATTMELGGSLDLAEKWGSDFFYTRAYLNNIDGMDLTPTGASNSSMFLYPMSNTSFVKKGSIWELDLYMPVFPTAVSTSGMSLIIETWIMVNGSNSYQQDFGTSQSGGLSFDNELSFMPNGFEAGKSYYFNLKAVF